MGRGSEPDFKRAPALKGAARERETGKAQPGREDRERAPERDPRPELGPLIVKDELDRRAGERLSREPRAEADTEEEDVFDTTLPIQERGVSVTRSGARKRGQA